MSSKLNYLSGFGNHFESECYEGTLPRGKNSPQKVAFGLFAEQLSGTAFTAARHENQRSWLYRIRPSVLHGRFEQIDNAKICSRPFNEIPASPNQMRWDPFPIPGAKTDFLDGLVTIAGNGGYGSCKGSAVHIYACNSSMTERFFYNADGDFLFVPEKGRLVLHSEFGVLEIAAGDIAVIPRGVKYRVELADGEARGYICENYGAPFRLPSLGPIGANGLANPRDFESPTASYEERSGSFKLICKFQGNLFAAEIAHSPLDVVAWHGNYVPYKYDLSRFNVINTVSFDHPDPSIFTVLTSPSEIAGTANVDFVIFPPRWMVASDTFRPPYYHRNVMSEYMGLIYGVYDAKEEGFVPGGGSLHNQMSAHGPDSSTFLKASTVDLSPVYMDKTLAFMFESSLVYSPTKYAASCSQLQSNYMDCWKDLPITFNPPVTQKV
ncbi:MAG: homogentisate 1,2-dioxygenase [Candidatus Obscuribacterales bacterium]|nr:homogentisate 1,2-dioxygenase [Candidatus Obscuribacterales bacterium]